MSSVRPTPEWPSFEDCLEDAKWQCRGGGVVSGTGAFRSLRQIAVCEWKGTWWLQMAGQIHEGQIARHMALEWTEWYGCGVLSRPRPCS